MASPFRRRTCCEPVNTLCAVGQRLALCAALLCLAALPAVAAPDDAKKRNILVIWGDDIGMWNFSRNNRGMMGYRTPNIHRLAKEGVGFTDYYAQQSCTGRGARPSSAAMCRRARA